jgi:alpha-tubulin suppressor-like RCC1 family protein
MYSKTWCMIKMHMQNTLLFTTLLSAVILSSCSKSNDPTPDPNEVIKWTAIDAGIYHAAGLKSDGSLWVWGDNSYYQLGNGSTADKNKPSMINNDRDWVFLTCGRTLSYAIKKDGSLWAWGQQGAINTYAGDGATSAKSIPTVIGNEKNWKAVSSGGSHTLALKDDGSLWAWGNNNHGQLGDNTNTNRVEPVPILSGSAFTKIYAGDDFSIAIKNDGSLWTWGSNLYGNLGNGTLVNPGPATPTQLGSDKGWLHITAAWGYVLAVKNDGSVWAWGKNTEGQLGLGHTNNVSLPTMLNVSGSFSKIDAMNHNSIALKDDGTIYLWGASNGNTPVLLNDAMKFTTVATGMNFQFAISQEGKLYAWGENRDGVLGVGSNSGTYTTLTEVP